MKTIETHFKSIGINRADLAKTMMENHDRKSVDSILHDLWIHGSTRFPLPSDKVSDLKSFRETRQVGKYVDNVYIHIYIYMCVL